MTKTTRQPRRKAAPPPAVPLPNGKLGVLVTLLSRKEGASIADLSAATGWLPHSVRGAMSGALKKNRGCTISSEKVDGVRIYRIKAEAAS